VHEIAQKRLFLAFFTEFYLLFAFFSVHFPVTGSASLFRIPFSCKAFQKGGVRKYTKVYGFRGGAMPSLHAS
jgi:hypothetical protein